MVEPTGAARFVIIDQDNATATVQQMSVTGTAVRLEMPSVRASFEGTLSAGGNEIAGSLDVGGPVPLTLKRVPALDQPPTFGEQERADVTALVNSYFAAFSRKDWDAFRNSIETVPFIRWGFSGMPNVSTVIDEVVKVSQTTRDGLDKTDYALSRAAEMIITPLSATTAMVDVHWRRDNKDGSLLGEGAEIITVTRTSAGWRINGVLGHSLSQFGQRF